MATARVNLDGLIAWPQFSADPGDPADGDSWYNTTDKAFRIRKNNQTLTLATVEEENVDSLVAPFMLMGG